MGTQGAAAEDEAERRAPELGGGGKPQLRALERGESEKNTELGLLLLSTWGTV